VAFLYCALCAYVCITKENRKKRLVFRGHQYVVDVRFLISKSSSSLTMSCTNDHSDAQNEYNDLVTGICLNLWTRLEVNVVYSPIWCLDMPTYKVEFFWDSPGSLKQQFYVLMSFLFCNLCLSCNWMQSELNILCFTSDWFLTSGVFDQIIS